VVCNTGRPKAGRMSVVLGGVQSGREVGNADGESKNVTRQAVAQCTQAEKEPKNRLHGWHTHLCCTPQPLTALAACMGWGSTRSIISSTITAGLGTHR
jgi:hypothetical protein